MLKGKKSIEMFTKHARHSATSVICSTQMLSDGNATGNAAIKNLLRNTDILTIHESPFIAEECARITKAMFRKQYPTEFLYEALGQAHKHSPAGIFEPLMLRLSGTWPYPEFRVCSNTFQAKYFDTLNFHFNE